ncbi:hypothetical protein KUTeg_020256 [Tegillarca granosa]|uniref:Uncharacterized protein n=1 Tax=Tegillarca granosa TaxID=220873 RepID=A0ABQ9E7E3_TEGGR|nr:hypothetical protein KUTeg_020256 [Tegillarca granosa]
MKAQIYEGILVLLALCCVGTEAQFNRTLRSSFDCNDINSLSRRGGYINWNGASLSSCSIDIFSTSNLLDNICVEMQTINIQDCSVEIEFSNSFDVIFKIAFLTWQLLQ